MKFLKKIKQNKKSHIKNFSFKIWNAKGGGEGGGAMPDITPPLPCQLPLPLPRCWCCSRRGRVMPDIALPLPCPPTPLSVLLAVTQPMWSWRRTWERCLAHTHVGHVAAISVNSGVMWVGKREGDARHRPPLSPPPFGFQILKSIFLCVVFYFIYFYYYYLS
jgi:hypothetical protein